MEKQMATTVVKTNDYTLTFSVKKVDLMPDRYHLKFESALNTAKDPAAQRKVFATTTDENGLNEIGRAIYETLWDK